MTRAKSFAGAPIGMGIASRVIKNHRLIIGVLAMSVAAMSLATEPALAADPSAEESLYISEVATATTGDLAPNAVIVGEGQPLSIDEAVAMSIQNNLDIEVARFGPMISGADRDAAWGAYDPTLRADMQYDVVSQPAASDFPGTPARSKNRTKGGGIGVDQLIPYLGATVSLDYSGSSLRSRDGFRSFDQRYDSSFFISGKIPVARNLIWSQAWTQVKTSKIDFRGSVDEFETSVMDIVQQTVNAYWSLVAARDQVRVSQKSLETARALLDQTNTQYEVGVVSRVEVVEAEAGVANREFDVISIANEYRNAQDALIDTVLGKELSALTDLEFSPPQDAAPAVIEQVDVGAAVETAFRKRPELTRAKRQIERSKISLKFAKNQRLPQFDIEARYGFNGVSGEPKPTPFDFDPTGDPSDPLTPAEIAARQGDFDQSDDNFFKSNGADNYRVRGVFSIPIPNTGARKRVVKSKLELQRSKTRMARQQQSIVLEVRRAARTLLASSQGIEAAERRRLAAQEQLRAERIRLKHGESTPFEVLQRESDLVEAESQKINALQTYRAAEVGLERAKGTILDVHRVMLDQVSGSAL